MDETYAVFNTRSGAEINLPIEIYDANMRNINKDLEELAYKLGLVFLYVDGVKYD